MRNSPSSVLINSPHEPQASIWARPFRFKMATPCSAFRNTSATRAEKRPERPGSSSRRSTISTGGHPLRSADRELVITRSAWPRAASDGAGLTKTQGTPALDARSMATSLACHVGTRSSWRASSCSSSTSTASNGAVGAHTAERDPMTTPPVTPAAQPPGWA